MAVSWRTIAAGLFVVLAVAACSGSDGDAASTTTEPATPSSEATSTSSTSSTTTTSTTEPTTTTLSDLELAEAEVAQIVVDWWEFQVDTSKGEEGLPLDLTTGLIRRRLIELLPNLEADGQMMRSPSVGPIEVTDVSVDLEAGTAERRSCGATSTELLDVETLEVLDAEDPTYPTVSTFQLQLIEGVWKISDFFPTLGSAAPVECEIEA